MKNIVRVLLIIILGMMVVHTLIYIACGMDLLPFPTAYRLCALAPQGMTAATAFDSCYYAQRWLEYIHSKRKVL